MNALPGTIPVEGRRFFYLEGSNEDAFTNLFPRIVTFGESDLPKSGGMLNENASIIVPDGRKFFCLSFRGDLNGWQRKLEECAENQGLNIARIEGESFLMSSEIVVKLTDCIIEYDH